MRDSMTEKRVKSLLPLSSPHSESGLARLQMTGKANRYVNRKRLCEIKVVMSLFAQIVTGSKAWFVKYDDSHSEVNHHFYMKCTMSRGLIL